MQKTVKRISRIIFYRDGWPPLAFAAILLIVLILVHYSDETMDNTGRLTGVITDVKFHYVRGPWLEFDIGGVHCCYIIADAGSMETDAVKESYERLAASGKTITAITTDKFDFSLAEGLRVVGVIGEQEECFSLASHNKRQLLKKIVFCIAPTFIILFGGFFRLSDIRDEIIVPAQKRKERRERKQAQKAKFADGQTVPQCNRNKKKKR